jgi:hypothetical protein
MILLYDILGRQVFAEIVFPQFSAYYGVLICKPTVGSLVGVMGLGLNPKP